MMWRTESGVIKKVGFYEPEIKPITWQRYADVFVPLLTLPTIFVIGLYLHAYMTDPNAAKGGHRSEIFALSGGLLMVSFLVFVYICIRLSAISGGRTRIRLPMIRTNRSQACFMKSVNSDLKLMTPLNNHPVTYESVFFDIPPYPNPADERNAKASQNNEEDGLTI